MKQGVGECDIKNNTLRRLERTKEEQITETLLRQVTIGMTALPQQEIGLRRQ